VVLTGAVGRDQRLLDQHAQHGPGEEHLDRAGVDDDLAGAGLHPDAGDGILALAGGIGAALLVELLGVFRGFGRRGGRLLRAELLERLNGLGHYAALMFLRFIAAISSFSGCWAAWGWSAPG